MRRAVEFLLSAVAVVVLGETALGLPAYLQSNYANPQTPQATVPIPYAAAQNSGSFNVVIVGWNDASTSISSVTDSNKNVYQQVVAPTVNGNISQAVYYAKNVGAAAAGANVVTVTFNKPAAYPDIRILEYSEIDATSPIDAFVTAAGSSATSNSGSLQTTNATDLLVAANTVATSTTGTSNGFTRRVLTNPDGDIAEDRLVTAAGSYNASPSLISPGAWVSQLIAFKAATAKPASAPTPAPAPSPTPNPGSTTPSYVQGNYATPQTPQSTITVPYPSAQTVGHLNVVVVGWNDSNTLISSVTDSSQNVYRRAIAPTVTDSISQAIYYAANIAGAAAGNNLVTVTFGKAAQYPDVRILEYNGIDPANPIDGFTGAIGDSGTSSSGALLTTNPVDLLVAANTVATNTAAASSGFVPRMLTTPDHDMVEDRTVTAVGSYSAVLTLGDPGPSVTQMVAFRAAGSQGGAPPPASKVSLAWNPDSPTSDPGTNPVGYRLYYGFASGNYSQIIDLGNTATATVSNLKSRSTYYFVTTAYNAAGIEGPPSNEVSLAIP
jgi:hypothetical protein